MGHSSALPLPVAVGESSAIVAALGLQLWPLLGLINGLKLQQLNQLNTKTVKSLHTSMQMLWHQFKPACLLLHLGSLNERVTTWETTIAEAFPFASQLQADPPPAAPWQHLCRAG